MKHNNEEIERYRLTAEKVNRKGWHPYFISDRSYGNNGVFLIPRREGSLLIQASDGRGWEHVSVSVFKKDRCPTWNEMCFVKDLFWNPDEVVIQYHPAEKDYVSMHDYCLHLWRPVHDEIPTPPPILVGYQKGITH